MISSRLYTLDLDDCISDITESNENERLLSMDLLNNILTCEMLVSSGLCKLILTIPCETFNIIDIPYMIVERLPRLKTIQVLSYDRLIAKFM